MTREEAIKVVKRTKGAMVYTEKEKEALETLIPELAESDDERIIRAIIDALYSHTNSINLLSSRGYQMEDIEAWLENQKECLTDNSKTSTDEDEMIRKELIGALMWQRDCLDAKGPHDNELILPGFTMKVGDILEWLEKQKESLHISETCKESADSFTDDDERIRKKLIEIIGYFRSRGIDQQLCEEFIAYLEKQKEQNGEDEECTDFTIYYPLKNGKGEYECIPYSFYDSLTFFSEDKDLIDFHRACFYTEEECNEWIEQHKEEEGYEAIPVESTLEYKLGFKAGKESEKQKEQKPKAKAKSPLSPHELYDAKIEGISQGRQDVLDHPEQFGLQKPAEWSEEDEKKLERVDDLLWMLDDYLGNDCSICEEKTARLRDEIHNELFPWLEFLRPQYHGDVTMTEAYKMGLEAGKASSWKPSEEQTNNVIVELTRIELGDIINGLYYLKEKYYEDCKEHNGTATVGLSDEFKFYFKRFNEVLDLYTRLHELEKEKYGTTTDGYYYE